MFALAPGDFYHVTMTYTATNQTAITTATNLATSGIRLSQLLNTNFGDFRLNAVSINSYSDNGQDPQDAGSALGHGAFDNLVLTVPYPPAQIFTGSISNSVWQAQLVGRTNWLFTLEMYRRLQILDACLRSDSGREWALGIVRHQCRRHAGLLPYSCQPAVNCASPWSDHVFAL